MMNELPAKFILAKKLEINDDLSNSKLSFNELWRIHRRAKGEFLNLVKEVQDSNSPWKELPRGSPKYSFLDIKILIAKKLANPCYLCERRCGVNREAEVGVCRVKGLKPCVDSYFLHLGEEAPLVPSGTIFYYGCNFRCVYCQNWSISQPMRIPETSCITPKELAGIQEALRNNGARNINHVGGEPTPHIPGIVESLKYVRTNVPQLWNSNMYLSKEAMEIVEDLIDIWLPDVKYGNNLCAKKFSAVPKYVEVVFRNVKRASMSGDMIVRHLVLPGHIECCTKRVIEFLSKEVPKALLNLMDQYYPDFLVVKYPKWWSEINRRIRDNEFLRAKSIAREAGYSGPIEDLWFISS